MQHIKHYSLCLLVVFALLLGALISAQPALAKDGTMKGNGTQESPYQIEDAKDLLAFAEEVNKSNRYEPEADINIWAELMKDIDLNPSYTYNQSTDQWTDAEGKAVEESKLEEWAPIADGVHPVNRTVKYYKIFSGSSFPSCCLFSCRSIVHGILF
ncbi:MAG: hypothetical protein UGE23_07425 [Peptococcaceae bacterium]|nr:hypothetical protein [Peptococcaceae bacterium]